MTLFYTIMVLVFFAHANLNVATLQEALHEAHACAINIGPLG